MNRQALRVWWNKNEDQVSGLTSEGVWVALGQLASLLGTLALIKVLTNYLDPSQFGFLALGLTLTNLVTQVFVGGLLNGIARYFPVAVEKKALSHFLASAANIIFKASAISFVLCCSGIVIATALGSSLKVGFLLCCVVFSILAAMNSAVIAVQNAARNRKMVALHATMEAWLKVTFAVVAFVAFGASSLAAIAAYIVATIVVLASSLTFSLELYRNSSVIADGGNVPNFGKQIFKFSYPFAIWGVFGWLQQSSARWSLEILHGTHEVGLYATLFQLGYAPIQIAIGVLTVFLQPILYAQAGDTSDKSRRDSVEEIVRKLVFVGFGMTLSLIVVACWAHDVIFRILTAPAFYSISYLLPWMVAAGGTFGVALVASSRLFALMSTKEAMPASIGSSLIGILAIFFGTYWFGVMGAVCGMFIHALSYLCFILLTKSKQVSS